MQLRERLLNEIPQVELDIDSNLPAKGGGYYFRDEFDPHGVITITGNVDYYRQNSILAEEIGHHETSSKNILDAYTSSQGISVNSLKEELKARRYGHDLAIPLQKLINCYEQDIWGNVYEMCLSMGIDRSYFHEIIEDYKVRYGPFVKHNGYVINFEPLDIEKLD
ncbi:MAG: ImmA/IrrE family metallo-endopeptidase [Staphylococcus xylosus]|uniref:ImmA/IrrE family metallo-endopeptidase n=1 Tax=Staphylococcus xylosus TaxID=1288 RepID=UPI000853BB55|nr:hypothetical protein [Staphylococcus xylosus]OEK87152.1 hypothetical protein AST14_04785 [Staphylococcus xylosus]